MYPAGGAEYRRLQGCLTRHSALNVLTLCWGPELVSWIIWAPVEQHGCSVAYSAESFAWELGNDISYLIIVSGLIL